MSRIENVSDTARWVAVYRARETERPNPLFRDPFARQLAGVEGDAIASRMRSQDRNEWAYVVRTILFDDVVRQQIAAGIDTVVNLAAGLDARPYRDDMQLPRDLRWFEVDLPEMIAYKEQVLRAEKPRCVLERVALDLTDADARRALFRRIDAGARKTLILCEGLLIYLADDEVLQLARDLAQPPSFQRWAFDLASPGLVRMLMKQVGDELNAAHAPLRFGPLEGTAFFAPAGWQELDVKSSFHEAGRRKLLPFPISLFRWIPPKKQPGNQPWSGICLMERA